MNYADLISEVLIRIGILVALVNIITEVVKKAYNFKTAQGINIFVIIVSIILTVLSFVTYFNSNGLQLTWMAFVAFIIVGFMVAYAAMFGFDKLLKYFEQVKE